MLTPNQLEENYFNQLVSFYDSIGRFPEIEEDEAPLYLLCTEYENFVKEL